MSVRELVFACSLDMIDLFWRNFRHRNCNIRIFLILLGLRRGRLCAMYVQVILHVELVDNEITVQAILCTVLVDNEIMPVLKDCAIEVCGLFPP